MKCFVVINSILFVTFHAFGCYYRTLASFLSVSDFFDFFFSLCVLKLQVHSDLSFVEDRNCRLAAMFSVPCHYLYPSQVSGLLPVFSWVNLALYSHNAPSVCVCGGGGGEARARVYPPRIVSRDKILRFTNTLIIIVTKTHAGALPDRAESDHLSAELPRRVKLMFTCPALPSPNRYHLPECKCEVCYGSGY